MIFGCDYYPEHWPDERWEHDANMMKAAGFNVVRLAEFAWTRLEPEEGKYDCDWLDRAINILAAQEIQIVLGTPTATPPAWLVKKHPELLRTDERGTRTSFGGRREYCPNSPVYREYSKKIVQAMAEHFGSNKAVIGWQTDNEFGGDHEKGFCYCPACENAWREWLKRKYGSLDTLNAEWGTAFWSHTYTGWEEIPLPKKTETAHSPSLLLDYRRFISDSYIDYQQDQIDILRKNTAEQFVTHNLMFGHFDTIDYYAFSKPLDFVVWDNYPKLRFIGTDFSYSNVSLSHDMCRGVKQRDFWIMEEQSGPSGWQTIDPTPRPGEIRLWTYQAIAHGADGIVYFRWRTCRFGTEQFWHGILDAAGTENRRYREVKQIGEELDRLGDTLKGMKYPAEAAMVNCYDTQWAFWVQPNNPQFRYREHFLSYYEVFNQKGVNVDVVSWDADFSGYKIVVVPTPYLLTDEMADKLKRFVENGGYLITTFRSGVKNWNNVTVEEPLPGKLTDLFGMEVEEYDSLPPNQSKGVQLLGGDFGHENGTGSTWCDIIKSNGAETVAAYTEDYYRDKPAVTANTYGKGKALYIGTDLSEQLKQAIISWALTSTCAEVNFHSAYVGVEVVRRTKDGREFLFILNHSDRKRCIELDATFTNLLTETEHSNNTALVLEPKGVAILVKK